MTVTNAKPGTGTLLKRGDGGVGASVKASRTIGTSNSQIVIKWATAGAIGNTKACEIVVSGNNTPLSVSVSQTTCTITSATNGSAVATSTINDIISKLSQDATFDQYWEATFGSGNGTGVLAGAASLAFLTSGSDGGETFTSIGEVKDVRLPNESQIVVDATHQQSTAGIKEYISGGLFDPGQVNFAIQMDLTNAQHVGLRNDLFAATKRNFQVVLPTSSPNTYSFGAFVVSFTPSAPLGNIIMADLGLQLAAGATLA